MKLRTILIVEDDADLRDTLQDVLREEQYNVLVVNDGLEALNLIQGGRESFDVILLDWLMPNLDGKAFLEAVKGGPADIKVPVVIMSAANSHFSEIAESAQRYNCRTLKKPFGIPELTQVIQGV